MGEKEKRTEEAVVETGKNKRNTCPDYLEVIPSACAFLCTNQYKLF